MIIKIFRNESPIEQATQKLEDFLIKNNMKITYFGGKLHITHNNDEGYIQDIENGAYSLDLPRTVESEKIVFNE
jgi:hypothetical protein